MNTEPALVSEQPQRSSHLRLLAALRRWWRNAIVKGVDQPAVIEKLRAESQMSARYLFMLSMSAGIAILGLLLSSPAVVIGAMLLAPLIGPLLGAGFALAIGDFAWLRSCARVFFIGVFLALIFCAVIVVVSPIQTVTEEIASRTRPSLFDLLVALFAALAGSYAMIRGREGTIVGVAIATALMPPLAAVGFGLATWNLTVLGGAAMLFATNMVTIALSAAIMARYYGFRTNLSDKQTLLQSAGIGATFVILAIPLGISLSQIAWESNASRLINSTIRDEFGSKARVSQIEIDFQAEPVRVNATVLTPEFRPQAEVEAERALRRVLGRPLAVSIDQFRVSADPRAAEQAQLAQARAAEQAAATERQIAELAGRLALIAGVEPNDVTIDRQNRRALVDAQPIEGTSLAGYRALEQRISASMPDWSIRLRPPLRPLPDIQFEDGQLTPEGRDALGLIAWAAERTGMTVGLAGNPERVAQVAQALNARGVELQVEPVDRPGTTGPEQGPATVRASWVANIE